LVTIGVSNALSRGIGEHSESGGHVIVDNILGFCGLGLFLGSWAYDFIDAPKQAKRMLVDSPKKVLIIPSIDKRRLKLELSLRF
jgi:hypothetical protein